METHSEKFKIRLGIFITLGLALFVLAIFIIGKQKNLFNPVFKLTTTFNNVGGLQIGSNIRFSGITIGTVDNIKIINDSTVQVDLLIQKTVQRFIKSDCEAGIGSSGIIGDKLLVITQGSLNAPLAKEGQKIASNEPIEMDAIVANMQVVVSNTAVLTNEIAQMIIKINSGKGALGRLIYDKDMAENINSTLVNLKKSSKGLDENMKAAKGSFLFKHYYKRKAKAAQNIIDNAK